jgi:hypothetical protein
MLLEKSPADHLVDIYVNKEDELSGESDAEDRGVGANLDKYTGDKFSTCDATQRWMKWNSK